MTATKVMIRNSEQSCFKDCRLKWYYAYVLNLKSDTPRTPLTFGTLWHAGLEGWYIPGKKRGKDPVKAIKRLYREYVKATGDEMLTKMTDKDGDPVTGLELGVHMMENYLAEYGQDEWFECISPEQTFQIPVRGPKTKKHPKGRILFWAVGTVDASGRDLRSGRIIMLEHKTGAGLEPFGAPIELDEQSGSYWTFGQEFLRSKGILPRSQEIEGILFNRARKAFKDQRPVNEDGLSLNLNGSISKVQPAPLFKREIVLRSEADRENFRKRWIAEAREMAMVRSGELEVYKNPDRHCIWCEFRDLCELEETGSDWESLAEMQYHEWEPYSAHEIAAEGKH